MLNLVKFDNFVWKMADFRQIGNADEFRKTMVFETYVPLINCTKFRLE